MELFSRRRYEGSYLPNSQTNLVIALHVLSPFFDISQTSGDTSLHLQLSVALLDQEHIFMKQLFNLFSVQHTTNDLWTGNDDAVIDFYSSLNKHNSFSTESVKLFGTAQVHRDKLSCDGGMIPNTYQRPFISVTK